jgi:hypothetical protein
VHHPLSTSTESTLDAALAANLTGSLRTPARSWINIFRRISRSTTPSFASFSVLRLPLFDFDQVGRPNFRAR